MRLLLMLAVAIPYTALAQDPEPNVIYQEVTEIDFGRVNVTGQHVKPHIAIVINPTGTDFNPLIRLRRNFSPEMTRSVDEVK